MGFSRPNVGEEKILQKEDMHGGRRDEKPKLTDRRRGGERQAQKGAAASWCCLGKAERDLRTASEIEPPA